MRYIVAFIVLVSVTLADDVAVQQFTFGNLLVTPNIYREILKSNQGNFMTSILSLELAMAFTLSGAKGLTAQQVQSSLRLPWSEKNLETAIQTLVPSLTTNRSYTFDIADKIYVQENFTIRPEFKKNATDVFYAEVENIDFSKNTEAANTINSWVEKKTKDKIKNLIDPRNLDSSTRAIIINAIYFQANWSLPFLAPSTKKANFSKSCKEVIQVDMMHRSGVYNYSECKQLGAKFLELPLSDKNASVVVVLPIKKNGLSDVELYPRRIFTPLNTTRRFVNVGLPKFLIASKFNLKELLQNLGITALFNISQADLSGIGGSKGYLVVNEVTQKTFVKVNEEGIEAAAATAVGITTTSVLLPPPNAVDFIADHPFIFYVKVDNLIVFVGRVVSPTASQ